MDPETSSFYEALQPIEYSSPLLGLDWIINPNNGSTPFNAFGYTWQKPSEVIWYEDKESEWMKKRLHEMGLLVGDSITPEQWEEAWRKFKLQPGS